MELSSDDLKIEEFNPIFTEIPQKRAFETGMEVVTTLNTPSILELLQKFVSDDNAQISLEYRSIDVVPARRHRKKRIQKKWIKRYGYKVIKGMKKQMDGVMYKPSYSKQDELYFRPCLHYGGKVHEIYGVFL